ncbi:unnamed protein product [Spirodela intermedia]|uniref:non-specific serine/threonine protein kinase n=1 Tax=Spirodela intermedia TaxID=51605 RepID=A0A7I8IAN9_SPIIN|nr:unnamed protein product [Spirodela intermedia]CAA6654786.1 unnamed protein product [Spirodela intermedia]
MSPEGLRRGFLLYWLTFLPLLALYSGQVWSAAAAEQTGGATRFDFGMLSLTNLKLLGDAHLNKGSIQLSPDLPVPNSGAGRALYARPVRFRHEATRLPSPSRPSSPSPSLTSTRPPSAAASPSCSPPTTAAWATPAASSGSSTAAPSRSRTAPSSWRVLWLHSGSTEVHSIEWWSFAAAGSPASSAEFSPATAPPPPDSPAPPPNAVSLQSLCPWQRRARNSRRRRRLPAKAMVSADRARRLSQGWPPAGPSSSRSAQGCWCGPTPGSSSPCRNPTIWRRRSSEPPRVRLQRAELRHPRIRPGEDHRPRGLRHGLQGHHPGDGGHGGRQEVHKQRRRQRQAGESRVPIRALHHRRPPPPEPRQAAGLVPREGEILLVYDYMPNGSLDKALYEPRSSGEVLSWRHRRRILTGIASALAYLHRECERQVIHRDVKSSNVMLDEDLQARLGDFGLARQVEHDKTPEATVTAGTMGYLAPEYLLTGRATEKTDVFSFGVVVLEVACGRRPIENRASGGGAAAGTAVGSNLVEWVWGLHAEGRLPAAADGRLAGEFDEGEMRKVLLVGLACAHPDQAVRPTMRSAVQMLSGETEPPFLPGSKPSMSFGSTSHHLLLSLQDSVSDCNMMTALSTSSSSSSVSATLMIPRGP